MENEKRFGEWIILKENLHNLGRVPAVREGEIWWCSFGENVGVEINGKDDDFVRPVVILKKFSKYGFLGVPLTSQDKTSQTGYVNFYFANKNQWAALKQIRCFSTCRLQNKMGTLSMGDYAKIKHTFQEYFK